LVTVYRGALCFLLASFLKDLGVCAMAKRLYCGNLSYEMSNSDLELLFTPFGDVASAAVVIDRSTGQSKGFGFVEMQRDNDALTAIKQLNDTQHNGRPLIVNEARPREERSGGGGGGYGGGGGGGGGGYRSGGRR
jgi:RNA recognition motif-containing protein